MGKLDGKVAFITGAARGQGRSHAVLLASQGADIIAVDAVAPNPSVAYELANPTDLEETARAVKAQGRRIVAVRADVRDRAELTAALRLGLTEFGRVDIVSANAGICPPGLPFWEISPEEWNDIIGVNLTGVWNTVSTVVPTMIEAKRGGSVILTSSSAAITCTTNMADYNASKAGVIALAKTMANELAPHDIRVNAICPAAVGTPMILHERNYQLFRPDLDHPTLADALPAFTSLHPLGRPFLEPIDVSNAVLWLSSDDARYVTGIALPVDLGWTNKAM